MTQNKWDIKELEEEYFILENNSEIDKDQLEFYEEALKDGYSMLLNCYEEND